jgi:hypothetical protein
MGKLKKNLLDPLATKLLAGEFKPGDKTKSARRMGNWLSRRNKLKFRALQTFNGRTRARASSRTINAPFSSSG